MNENEQTNRRKIKVFIELCAESERERGREARILLLLLLLSLWQNKYVPPVVDDIVVVVIFVDIARMDKYKNVL